MSFGLGMSEKLHQLGCIRLCCRNNSLHISMAHNNKGLVLIYAACSPRVSEELCSTSLRLGTQVGRACAAWSVANCHDGGERV